MKKTILCIMAIAVLSTGCGKEDKKTTTNIKEHVIEENVIEETILWENVEMETWE